MKRQDDLNKADWTLQRDRDMKRRKTNPHWLKNAPYYRMWERRYRPFRDWYLYMVFSQQYFEKLKRELELTGYEITADRGFDCWYSDPVGYFGVSNLLKGESFVFFMM